MAALIVGTTHRLLDLLFPPRCASCGASGALLCDACRASIRPPSPPLCPDCGRSLPALVPSSSDPPAACSFCARGQRPIYLTGLRAASTYEGAVRQAVRAFKYRGQRRLAGPLADLLTDAYRDQGIVADLIIPVPLHPIRRRSRGYDQAELLARALAARLHLPLRSDLLVRQRDTRPQTTLTGAERRANVANAFALARPAAGRILTGRCILLLDDVTTTGSTLDAAAAALKAAGPVALWGLAAARPAFGDADS